MFSLADMVDFVINIRNELGTLTNSEKKVMSGWLRLPHPPAGIPPQAPHTFGLNPRINWLLGL